MGNTTVPHQALAAGAGAALGTAAPPRAATTTARSAAAVHSARIGAIDLMRGLVMLFMLVDHVREAIYLHMQVGDPVDPLTTAPALYFTRLTAHLCAPTFVFLTGLGAWLYAHPPAGAERPVGGFLLKRGLLLVALELTLVSFAWTGDFPLRIVYLQVIWAIGLSMIVLAALARLPLRWLAALGFLIVFGHNALSGFHIPAGAPGHDLWTVLHDRGWLVENGPLKVKVSYPVLPWIGVILLGFAAGPIYGRDIDSDTRRAWLLRLGLGCLALLAVLRGFNIYGETLPWSPQADTTHTAMSWLAFTKYPPSLDFLLLTLGFAFLLLRAFEHIDNGFARAIRMIGGAPMFFYLLHLYVLLLLQKGAVALFGANHGVRFGVDHVYWIWITAAVLAVLLYFPCSAFARYKRSTRRAWVRYF